MEKIWDLLWTDPDDLLDEDQALLEEIFPQLEESMAINAEYLVLSIKMAMPAVEHE